jgi:hypothetical protein
MKTNKICQDCGCTKSYPLETREQKRIKDLTGKEQLICWMGPSGGVCLCDGP